MSTALTYTLSALSLLLLAAHALRMGDLGQVACWLALAGFLFAGKQRLGAWSRVVVIAGLSLGLFIWAQTTLNLIQFRMAFDQGWLRLAAIMAGVMLVNGAAMFLLLVRGLPARGRREAGLQAGGFLLTFGLLWLTREMTPMTILLADRYLPGWGMAQIFLLSCYAAWLLGKMAHPEGARRWRPRLWALFTIVFFGQLLLGLAGLERMLMTGNLHLPVPALIVAGPIFRGYGFFMPILFTATVLLVGPAWCSHLCYIGVWDDMCSRLHKKKRPTPLPAWTRWSRPAILALAVAAAIILRMAGIPPIQAVILAAVFGLAGVGIMVFISRKNGHMVHCSGWCPIGFVSTMLGRLTPWRIRLGRGCTRCGRCARVCKYAALDAEAIDRGRPSTRCTLCGDCVSGCPHGFAGYRFLGLRPDAARALFLVVVVSLHAAFLGVARI